MKQYCKLLRLILALGVCGGGGAILHHYEYWVAFSQIDNVVGMLPLALVLVFVVGCCYLLLASHKNRVPQALLAAGLVVAAGALFPTALRGNWWLFPTTVQAAQAAPDLTVYAPFSPNSQTAKLQEDSILHLTDSLPVLDGATALYPVYAAFAEATYDPAAYTPQLVQCTNTSNAYQAVIAGGRDIIFVATASQKQREAAKQAGADLHFTPIGREAFVFLVGTENPVESLSSQQLRNIYSGKTAHWSTLGWAEGGKLIAFQRPSGSGSQTGLEAMMGTLPIQVPQPLPDPSLMGTNSLMQQVSVRWNGVQPALGYSYRYYATTMYANPNVKLLHIDGVAPTPENIQSGAYPFVSDFYAVTRGAPQGNAKVLLDWVLSPQGQELIEKTGYAPLLGK